MDLLDGRLWAATAGWRAILWTVHRGTTLVVVEHPSSFAVVNNQRTPPTQGLREREKNKRFIAINDYATSIDFNSWNLYIIMEIFKYHSYIQYPLHYLEKEAIKPIKNIINIIISLRFQINLFLVFKKPRL